MTMIDKQPRQLAVVNATQDYVTALQTLNTVLRPMGMQVPMAMAVKL
jgi:hypothetical protein